jgi:hypothetical protein
VADEENQFSRENVEHLDIPESHYAAMGKVANTWAGLELSIDYLIWELMDIDQIVGACVTAQFISVHPRLRAASSLARLRGAKASADELLKFAGDLGGLAYKRNRMIHDKRLVTTSGEVKRFEIATTKELKFGLQPEEIEDLRAFKTLVETKIEEFDHISDRIRVEIAASLPTLPEGIERLHRLPTNQGPLTIRTTPRSPYPPSQD